MSRCHEVKALMARGTALIAIPVPMSKELAAGWPGTSEFEQQTANSRLRLAHFPFLRVC